MTTTASLEHPRLPDVSLPIRGEGGDPLVSRDFGKPHLELYENVEQLNPKAQSDQWNGLENFTIATTLTGTDAYKTARQLADHIKSPQAGSLSTFKPNLPAYDSSINVVQQAEQEEALTLTYPPGTTDYVEVEVGLTRIGRLQGDDFGTRAQTSTASGTGPIELRGSSTVIELGTGIEVERSVGRPNSPIDRDIAKYPRYTEKRKAAYDAFSISFTATTNPTSLVSDLLSLFRSRNGRDTPVLDFNGQYSLGAFDVQLVGSGGLRHVDRAAEGGVIAVPTLDLRVVSG
jgi:hypothetical protein